jgi:PAS domain S-box-containing protein
MADQSIRSLHARIASILRWISVLFLVMLLSFFAIFVAMSSLDRRIATRVWKNLFLNRLAEMEAIADSSMERNPDWIVHNLIISTDGEVMKSPVSGMVGLRLNAAGFFGRIHDLAPGHTLVLFFPDLVDGLHRVHFIKHAGHTFIILSVDPGDFFPLPITGYARLSVATNGIIWYADEPARIGNVSRSFPFSFESGRLYASVRTTLSSMPDSRLIITQDISLRALILLSTLAILAFVFWLLTKSIRGLPYEFSTLQNEHKSQMGMIEALSKLFETRHGSDIASMDNLAEELQTILEAGGLRALKFDENRQYQALVANLCRAVMQLVASLAEDRQRLETSEKRFRAFIEQSPLAICLVRGSTVNYANPKFLSILGLDEDEVLAGIDAPSLLAPEEQEASRERLRRRSQGLPVPNEGEFIALRRDSSLFPVYLASSRIDLPDGPAYLTCVIDISERKNAEERLRSSLAEKEVLLRELYHRTRNNMNVIVAMLSLQAEYSGDENLKAPFAEAQSRIQSMALVHQKLYDSQDLSRLNLKDYIADLIRLFTRNQTACSGEVCFKTKLEDVFVLFDTAIPCGLVMSEILSNSLRHAFPDGRTGIISIDLALNEEGTIRLRVADDGVGLPPGFDPRTDGRMGLNFIFMIGEGQLDAVIEMTHDHGVSYELTFKDDIYKARV